MFYPPGQVLDVLEVEEDPACSIEVWEHDYSHHITTATDTEASGQAEGSATGSSSQQPTQIPSLPHTTGRYPRMRTDPLAPEMLRVQEQIQGEVHRVADYLQKISETMVELVTYIKEK